MRTFTRIALLGLTVPMLAALPSTAAFAAPTNAPYSFPGTADCGPDGTFDFVVNTGQSEANTWNPAFASTSDGRTALFIPASLDATFTTPFGTETFTVSKHTAPGPVSCEISATPFPGASLTGTATGRLVWTG
jgi:hypothetical protein